MNLFLRLRVKANKKVLREWRETLAGAGARDFRIVKFEILAPRERLLALALGVGARKWSFQIGSCVVNAAIRPAIQHDVVRQHGETVDVSDARDPLQRECLVRPAQALDVSVLWKLDADVQIMAASSQRGDDAVARQALKARPVLQFRSTEIRIRVCGLECL